MPSDANVTISADVLSSDFCHENWPATFAAWAALLHGTLPGTFSSFNFGNAVPDPADQDKPWIRTNADGTLDGLYVFAGGYWARPYPVPASAPERRIWEGTTTLLETYDGGANVAVTDYTGPFWEVDTNYAARMILAPGTLPSGSVVAVTSSAGSETNTLIKDNLPDLPVSWWSSNDNNADADPYTHQAEWGLIGDDGATGPANGRTQFTDEIITIDTQLAGVTTPISNLPPYRSAYIIKRTARIYITV